MTPCPMRSLGTVLSLVAALVACHRSDESPPPPKAAMAEPSAPQGGRVDPAAPAGTGSAMSGSGERGASGVSGSSAGPVAGSDRIFVSEAANSSMAEVEAGRLVAGRTGDAAIKEFAEQMERDHSSAGDELKRIANEKGIDIPSTIAGEPRGQLSRLVTLSAPDMDRSFVEDFGIGAHQKAISLFERQAREGQDADLRAYAERTLPRLREHLAQAQQMQTGRLQGGPR